MSKFFHGLASESSGSESSDEDSAPVQAPVRATTTQRTKLSDLRSDSEEETKRVVYSAKDKRNRELKELIRKLRNAKKIKDMNACLEIFEDIAKAYQKAKSVMEKEGSAKPRFLIRCFSELGTFIDAVWEDREGRKNMSKQNSKGLSTLRQKLRKYLKEKELDGDIESYREEPDPDGYTSAEQEAGSGDDDDALEDDDSSDTSDDEGDSHLRRTRQRDSLSKGRMRASDDSETDSEEEWLEEDSDSSDSDLEDLEGKKMEDLRRFFLKKTDDEKAEKERKRQEKKGKDKKRGEKGRDKDRAFDDEGWTVVPASGTTVERPKMFEKEEDITHESVLKKMDEILKTRGKKGTNRRGMVSLLTELKTIAENKGLGVPLSVKITLEIIAGMFDYNPKMSESMEADVWKSALEIIMGLVVLLNEHQEITLRPELPEEQENLLEADGPIVIKGSLLEGVLERLDDEFTKLLQAADCHSTDYVEKLKGEADVVELIENVQRYFESKGISESEMCRIYMRRIEHLYYKFDYTSLKEESNESDKSQNMMNRLCQFIYAKDKTRRLRERAVLCHIYFLALHDQWQKARDLMLMSHLQITIENTDDRNKVLYNRALCQLGLCAFRHGFIKEAHSTLSDMQNSGKAKELLAQGVQGMTMRSNEKTAEEEKKERDRQIPYHMHVNLELLECVYLICSMLLEIPQIASRDHEMRRKMLSRSFHYQLKQSERTTLLGPPENTREHVVAASRALLSGDWEACRDFIINEKMNAKVWNLFPRSDRVRQMVVGRIQEESLRTYLLAYSTVYTTVSITSLMEMFSLTKKAVHSMISRLIIQEELSASLDEPAECLVMHRVEPTRLQILALQLTEKLGQFAEQNDQILDPKSSQSNYNVYRSSSNQWFAQRQQGKQDDYRGGGRGRGGGGYRNQNQRDGGRSGYNRN